MAHPAAAFGEHINYGCHGLLIIEVYVITTGVGHTDFILDMPGMSLGLADDDSLISRH
jgi:hypothetical protein